jgi:predicted nucleic-acid-binding protein
MIGLDTNVVVRYLLNDDAVQSAAATHLIEERLKTEGPGYISLVTIAETAWLLSSFYGHSVNEIALVIEEILASDHLFVQNEREVFAAMIELKTGRASFPDALVGALGQWAGCAYTATFDRKASRLTGFRHLA